MRGAGLYAFLSRQDARARAALVQHGDLRKPREAGCAPETRQAQAHPTDEEIITRRQKL
jgi:hypothetical protein